MTRLDELLRNNSNIIIMQFDQNPSQRSTSFDWLKAIGSNLPLFLFLFLATVGMFAVYWFYSPTTAVSSEEIVAQADLEDGLWAPIYKNVAGPPPTQRLTQSPGPIRIGIISGHRGFDAGAVCSDGLTEAMINADIAEQVTAVLQQEGINIDILDEFDPRLNGYAATALLSIHADSCQYVNDLATGYKVAGSSYTDSTPLSTCVEQAYAATTQLPYHANTITPDMADYHAFREIALGTQAAIIETGFMYLDRELLTTNTAPVVQGIVDGLHCFLNTATVRQAGAVDDNSG